MVLVLNTISLNLLSYTCQYQSLGIERIVLLSEALEAESTLTMLPSSMV